MALLSKTIIILILALPTLTGCNSGDGKKTTAKQKVAADYQYSVPATIEDGWQTADANTLGVNIEPLITMTNKILNGEHSVIDGIVIIKDHQLIYEHYFNNYTASKPHELQSAVKSIDSTLVGLAIEQGYLTDVNQLIYPLLPAFHHLDWSNDKNQITISDLLTMRSGFPCHDGREGDCNSHKLNQSDNWTKYTLEQTVHELPGSKFSYFTGLNIVSHTIIENLTGMSIDEFAMKNLFTPLGISEFTWSHSPAGEALSGDMLPRDMAKFGQLYLNKGLWHGKQVIPELWVEDSLTEHVLKPEADGWGYGYWWWINKTNNDQFQYYAARGAKDQYIFIVPELELVVVFTGNRDSGDAGPLLENYILPAFQ